MAKSLRERTQCECTVPKILVTGERGAPNSKYLCDYCGLEVDVYVTKKGKHSDVPVFEAVTETGEIVELKADSDDVPYVPYVTNEVVMNE